MKQSFQEALTTPVTPESASHQNTRFGLISYFNAFNSVNLGDDIQSLAVRRLLPRVDFFVEREQMHCFVPSGDLDHRLIVNGWFMMHPDRWPPADGLNPLFISFHLSQSMNPSSANRLPPATTLLNPPNLKYLSRFAPIGARDLATQQLLEKAGVESYFSGCLGLTLPERDEDLVEDLVCLVDLDEELVEACRRRTKAQIRVICQYQQVKGSERLARAEALLQTYSRAKCVVTTKMHAALRLWRWAFPSC